MSNEIDHRIHPGNGAKEAFNTLIETELCWLEEHKLESSFLKYKRYKIVSTEQFSSKEEAFLFINANKPFKMRANSAGCVIINSNEELKYLFFAQQ